MTLPVSDSDLRDIAQKWSKRLWDANLDVAGDAAEVLDLCAEVRRQRERLHLYEGDGEERVYSEQYVNELAAQAMHYVMRVQRMEKIISKLQHRNRELEQELADTRETAEKYSGGWRELTRENARLRDELEDYREDYRRVLAEECAPDERHCACVPALRAEIARLREAREEADELAQIAYHVGRQDGKDAQL